AVAERRVDLIAALPETVVSETIRSQAGMFQIVATLSDITPSAGAALWELPRGISVTSPAAMP
ncbi:MAG: hypothetical protein AAF264_09450, partial [Pseudomonadota bacterium]